MEVTTDSSEVDVSNRLLIVHMCTRAFEKADS